MVLENIKLLFYKYIKAKKTDGVGEHFSAAVLAQLNKNPVEHVRFAQKLEILFFVCDTHKCLLKKIRIVGKKNHIRLHARNILQMS